MEQVTKLLFEPLNKETCLGTNVYSDPPSVRKFVNPFVGAFLSQYWPVSGANVLSKENTNTVDSSCSAMITISSFSLNAELSFFERLTQQFLMYPSMAHTLLSH